MPSYNIAPVHNNSIRIGYYESNCLWFSKKLIIKNRLESLGHSFVLELDSRDSSHQKEPLTNLVALNVFDSLKRTDSDESFVLISQTTQVASRSRFIFHARQSRNVVVQTTLTLPEPNVENAVYKGRKKSNYVRMEYCLLTILKPISGSMDK